jgi:phage baseplate assembly protein gpV
MSYAKSRFVRFGLALAGALGVTAVAVSNGATAHEPSDHDNRLRVDAPGTAVRVDKETGKVAVRAPYTSVKVDPDTGRVRVRAPYVNLDVRW